MKNKYQSTKTVALPHFGCLWRSLAAHEAMMMLKIILFQGLGKSTSNLFLGVNGEYFDKPLGHMFTKMMIAYVNVLGPTSEVALCPLLPRYCVKSS
jgi:hypothetical protein